MILIRLKNNRSGDPLKNLIDKDPHLKELFELITSVPGVGSATASEVIIATNEFTAITDPKKLAASAVRLSCRGCPF
ncbi:transposase [Runella sp. CRIBMP]|uniref:transposase n=1 Tax=Runella sp. CRIBMP TaxID=2683261 RepID=UPI0038F7E8C2